MTARLRRQLEEAGQIVKGSTRRARPGVCRSCGARVVAGLTAEPMGTLAVVDPAPLSSLGETLALMTGRTTYDLVRRVGRLEVDDRDSWQITGSPADLPDGWRRTGDVVAAHVCGAHALPGRESRITK